ncbi:microsomal epoxide hydrolase [Xylariales sp. PMI_506]|nr:microsomal epoxide hydrolase [Xylariales sp. PMI_506]
MMEIKPYRISVPDSQISDLKDRLSRVRFPDELEAAEWDMGAPLGEVQRLAKYWAESYDWRSAEAQLNEFPQYTAELQADGFDPINVHFIHRKSAAPDAIPLIFVHGWPGSFYEATKIIEPLTRGGEGQPAFHVVVPSLPNFGFSGGVSKRGFSVRQHAEVLHKLMRRLGYDQYVTQGGDWGWTITRAMSLLYPRHVRAQHLNGDVGQPPRLLHNPRLAVEAAVRPWTAREKAGLARTGWFRREGTGYFGQQASKPQTLGYGLADSPVALLAWVYEKLRDWTDSYPWTDDEVLTWISIYWFSAAGPAASVRLYYEYKHEDVEPGDRSPLDRYTRWQDIPVGLAHFPLDISALPATWTRGVGRIVYEKVHPSGGHFAAWERPDDVVGDLRAMFGKNGGAREVIRAHKL